MGSEIIVDPTSMDVRAIVKQMMASAGFRGLSAIAERTGMNESTLRNSLHSNRIRFVDFVRIAEVCGFQVIVKSSANP